MRLRKFGVYLFILAFGLRINNILGDENVTFTAKELHERSAKDGDYLGCFPQGCLHFDYVVNISEAITPDSCTATCKEHGFPYVAIHNRTECACSCEQICMNKQLDDESCGLPCRGDFTTFCGGYDGASVYAVFTDPSGGKCIETTADYGKGGNATVEVTRRLPVIISAVAALCVALPAGVILGHFIQRRLRIQATTNQSEDIENKEGPESPARLLSYPCTDAMNKSFQDLSADIDSHIYSDADHRPVHYPSTVIESTSNTSSRQPDIDLKAVKADGERFDPDEYHKYMDMHSKVGTTRAEVSERDSMTDADGYIVRKWTTT